MDSKPIKPTSSINWGRLEDAGFIALRVGMLALGVVALLRCADII